MNAIYKRDSLVDCVACLTRRKLLSIFSMTVYCRINDQSSSPIAALNSYCISLWFLLGQANFRLGGSLLCMTRKQGGLGR